jgi:hypothetical protein
VRRTIVKIPARLESPNILENFLTTHFSFHQFAHFALTFLPTFSLTWSTRMKSLAFSNDPKTSPLRNFFKYQDFILNGIKFAALQGEGGEGGGGSLA